MFTSTIYPQPKIYKTPWPDKLDWLVTHYKVLCTKGFYYSPFCFLRPHNILSAMLTKRKQRKIIVPTMLVYADVAHPTMPRISPTANTGQTMALLALFDIELPSYAGYLISFTLDLTSGLTNLIKIAWIPQILNKIANYHSELVLRCTLGSEGNN